MHQVAHLALDDLPLAYSAGIFAHFMSSSAVKIGASGFLSS